jgi:hypothetical protein
MLTQDKWLDDGEMTDSGGALIEECFRDFEAKPRASVFGEETDACADWHFEERRRSMI